MKKLIALALLVSGLAVVSTSAQDRTVIRDRNGRVVVVQDNDRDNRRNQNRRWNDRRNDRNDIHDNYGLVVRDEQRYIRVGRRVYREIYRSTYTRFGQLINRQLIRRERVRHFERYNNRDFQRKTGNSFGIYFRIGN